MKVSGIKHLDKLCRSHTEVCSQVEAWLAEVRHAKWCKPHDIKARYPSASILGDKIIIFNLKGNKYRLAVKVAYRTQTVIIVKAGTHAEYSNWTF